MAPKNDWTSLRDLFDRTANLDAGQRARLLDHECGEDLDLRLRVEEMLAAHDAAGGFLAAPTEPQAGSRALTLDATTPALGTIIGPYKLLQQIGEGGFGAVYMAEQQEPIVRKVALKVIKLGMDTKQVIARFEAERQALALMDHPNIARIFEAGATDTGRPYFVMELVRGIPITEYCDRERLTTRQRLEIFLPVCHAVAHAHQKGVIHRDLKPSNVLVTLHDGTPVPKVIDFGIARAIHQRLTERTLFTEFGQMIGTPEYMSPEQAEMSGLDIDTRSDIYSLGALLYELLTGEKLFDPRRLRSLALRQIQRVLREEEPPRPSARVSSLGVTAPEVAHRRGVQAPQLVRLLRGDPDWIVLKAIAKDRRRRYDSAGALAEDIERSLRSEPVSAGPPGIPYRASRFIRRHRLAATVALALATSLILGIGVATVGLVRARRAESVARREARLNAIDVEAMRALLKEDQPGYVARVNEAVALRRASVPMDTLALADYLTTTFWFLEALEFITDSLPPPVDSLRTRLGLEAIDVLTSIQSARRSTLDALDLMRKEAVDRYPERLPDILRRILFHRERGGAPDSVLVGERRTLARLLRQVGTQAGSEGQAAVARSALFEAVDLEKLAGAGNLLELAAAQGDLGDCLTNLGEYAAAESLLLKSYRVLGAREQLMRLVRLYEKTGRRETARSYAARTQVASVRELGPLPGVSSTTGRSEGFSGKLGDRWIWLFGPARASHVQVADPFAIKGMTQGMMTLRGPPFIRWTSWSWTKDRDARDGITLQHPVDAQGVPLELLSLTPAEQAQRDRSDSWLYVSPAALIEDPTRKRALLLYRKIAGGTRVGASFAIWELGAPGPRRVVVRPGTADPTLLFQGDEPDFSEAALVIRDTFYLYGGLNQVGHRQAKVVGRVPLARALDRTAWRFYSGDRGWSSEVRDAKVVTDARVDFSVHWNAYLGKFVLISMVPSNEPLDGRIAMMTADRPEGPWSPSAVIHTAVPPPKSGYGAVFRPAIHIELSRESGRVAYLTYERHVGFLDAEVRLVEVVFK